MANKHILTVDEFRELARPTSKHIDVEEVLTFIRECEDMFIIPGIGLSRFKRLLEDSLSVDDKILLSGGEYKDEKNTLYKCSGLKLALSYFVYAKMTMADGGMLTRTGMMQHNDSYASREEDKNKVRRYNEAMNVAESYFNSCLAYIKSKETDIKPVRGTRLRVHAIGD